MTEPRPDGSGVQLSIDRALQNTRVDRDRVRVSPPAPLARTPLAQLAG